MLSYVEAKHADGYMGRFTRDAMRRFQQVALAVSLAVLMTACPAPSGLLLPVAQDGVAISSTRRQNDTAQTISNEVEVKALGEWERSTYYFTVVVANKGDQAVSINFQSSSLVSSRGAKARLAGFGEKASMDAPRNYNSLGSGSEAKTLDAKVVRARQERIFVVPYGIYADDEPRIDVGDELELAIPVKVGTSGEYVTTKLRFKSVSENI